jgi:hypothetical protein
MVCLEYLSKTQTTVCHFTWDNPEKQTATNHLNKDRFMSNLTNRRQKVEVKSPNSTENVFSDGGILKRGVPHGSILGPPLFTTYIK